MPQARTRNSFTKHATDYGTYWTSALSSRDNLAHLRSFIVTGKQAMIGGDQETGFEQAFASLAYSYLKDKAPRLLNFAVGFQLVDRNDDNSKAAGIFGFKVGKQWLYAPVFFINGDLKGHELLYVKNQDAFVPMKENWVNYLMSRKPHVLGEGSQKDVFQLGGLSPNIERLSYPPTSNKYGSDALGIAVDSWASDFLPVLASCKDKRAAFIWRDQPREKHLAVEKIAQHAIKAALLEVPTLAAFLKEADWRYTAAAYEWTKQYPGMKRAFDRFYGQNFFHDTFKQHKQARDAAALNVLPAEVTPQALLHQASKIAAQTLKLTPAGRGHYLSRLKAANDVMHGLVWDQMQKQAFAAEPKAVLPVIPLVKYAAGDAKVKIIVKNDVITTDNLPDKNLTDDEKERVVSHGYLVKDERAGDEITKVYNTTTPQTLTMPDQTGLYDVLESPGEFSRMLVLKNPISNSGGQSFVTLIRLEGGDKAWLNVNSGCAFSKAAALPSEFRDWWDKLPKKKAVEVGATYIAISGSGEATVPFKVREKYDTGRVKSYRVDFESSEDYRYGRPHWKPLTQNDMGGAPTGYNDMNAGNNGYISNYGATLILNGRNETCISAVGGDLYVPTDTFKFFKLKNAPDTDKDSIFSSHTQGHSGSEPAPIKPGDLKDMQMFLHAKTASLRLFGDAHEVSITGEKTGHHRCSYGEALFNLIRTHGVHEETAKAMLKEAQARASYNDAVAYRVKYADPYPLPGAGPTAPTFPAPTYGTEPIGYNNVTSIYPQEDNIPVPALDSSRTDPRIYDPFLRITPDQQVTQFAQQASADGQKEVFDASAIAGLLKTVRTDTISSRYLGDLMKAMDRIGRILMLVYWHSDEMSDTYGKSKMPELEDSGRNTFESLGDLVLFLKEQEIDPGSDSDMTYDLKESARH